jgi:hypothetical protein
MKFKRKSTGEEVELVKIVSTDYVEFINENGRKVKMNYKNFHTSFTKVKSPPVWNCTPSRIGNPYIRKF